MKNKKYDSHIHSIRGMVSEGEGRPQWDGFAKQMDEVIEVLEKDSDISRAIVERLIDKKNLRIVLFEKLEKKDHAKISAVLTEMKLLQELIEEFS